MDIVIRLIMTLCFTVLMQGDDQDREQQSLSEQEEAPLIILATIVPQERGGNMKNSSSRS